MAIKADGTWECDVLTASVGENEKRMPIVRVNVRLTGGPDAGKLDTYDKRIDGGKGTPYVARSLKAIGWQGRTLATLAEDVKAWVARTGGKTTCEIKHWEVKNGARAGELYASIDSLGSGRAPLGDMSRDTMRDADEALARAMGDMSTASAGNGEPYDAPHPADGDDIPFVTRGGRW